MKREYLGDSYDAVKRLWQQILADWAPLYAEPKFIPEELQNDFTRLTGIQILTNQRPKKYQYSILNDPDTGIRLPCKKNQREGRTHIALKTIVRTHIALKTIVKQLRTDFPRCVITFDQSYYRNSRLNRIEQRQVKL